MLLDASWQRQENTIGKPLGRETRRKYMCKVLMSINPEHVNNILSGTKRFEFRKNRCKEKVDAIIIYSTSPIMQVVGEVEVKGVIVDEPQAVWMKTQVAAGIDKGFFDRYYCGRSRAVAYILGEVTIFSTPKHLEDYGVKSAPQSYVYIR